MIEAAHTASSAEAELRILLDVVKKCFSVKTARGEIITGITNNPRLELNLRNIERFLDQMRYDPSISKKLLDEWKTMPTHNLETQDAKYQYASLYAQLVTEWQSAEK